MAYLDGGKVFGHQKLTAQKLLDQELTAKKKSCIFLVRNHEENVVMKSSPLRCFNHNSPRALTCAGHHLVRSGRALLASPAVDVFPQRGSV